jgi:succinyl-CoA synthetase beta subunit
MILTEFEGKQLLKKGGLLIPDSFIVNNEKNLPTGINFPVMVKAQVLHGNRAELDLITTASNLSELKTAIKELLQKKDQLGQKINQLLVETMIKHDQQFYLSLNYDTNSRGLVAAYSSQGGVGMDDRGKSIITQTLSLSKPPVNFKPNQQLLPVVQKLYRVFLENDATLIEVNPLVNHHNHYYCLDAKIQLDDQAKFRHPEWKQYPQRSLLGRPFTARELKAKKVSRLDHRGVAGESFFEFKKGKIGIMASGGGASTLVMDALLTAGLKPANYTEYSGNPTKEKVKQLTKIVLSIPKLNALYVVGGNANFTDIYQTLSGVVDGLLTSWYVKQPNFILLIRRGGPKWQEAFRMVEERLKNYPLTIKLLGPDFPIVNSVDQLKKMLNAK